MMKQCKRCGLAAADYPLDIFEEHYSPYICMKLLNAELVAERARAEAAEAAEAGAAALGKMWRDAALRVGEELATDGPRDYDTFGPDRWREWAIAKNTARRSQLEIVGGRADDVVDLLNDAKAELAALRVQLATQGQVWRPLSEPPVDENIAYLLARWDGDDWYYGSAYWCRYTDMLEDGETERFTDGEYEWFVFYGEEPHPLDTRRYSYWSVIHPAPDGAKDTP